MRIEHGNSFETAILCCGLVEVKAKENGEFHLDKHENNGRRWLGRDGKHFACMGISVDATAELTSIQEMEPTPSRSGGDPNLGESTLDFGSMIQILEKESGAKLGISAQEDGRWKTVVMQQAAEIGVDISFEMFILTIEGYYLVDFADRIEEQIELLEEWGNAIRAYLKGSFGFQVRRSFFLRRTHRVMVIRCDSGILELTQD